MSAAFAPPASDLAATLGIAPAEAEGVATFGRAAAHAAEEALSAALAQPVWLGGTAIQRMEPAEVEQEDWNLYHPVDLRWETAAATYTPVLLLPRAELQTLLPAAQGAADLPDMEALGRLLHDLADQLTAALQPALDPPVTFSLADVTNAPHDTDQPMVRVEHRLAAGREGMQT